MIAREGICGMEVVEIAPPYDVSDMTAQLGCRAIMDVLGTLVEEGLPRARGRGRPASPSARRLRLVMTAAAAPARAPRARSTSRRVAGDAGRDGRASCSDCTSSASRCCCSSSRPRHLAMGPAGAFTVGLGLTAYTLGLRHAFDADHISAIDNTTRKLMADGERPLGVGLLFSLGHSTVVFVLALLLAVGVRSLGGQVRTPTLAAPHGQRADRDGGVGRVPVPDRGS